MLLLLEGFLSDEFGKASPIDSTQLEGMALMELGLSDFKWMGKASILLVFDLDYNRIIDVHETSIDLHVFVPFTR
jgi:hypothetical protein